MTQSEARDRVYDSIDNAFAQDGPTLVEALPAMGKSYNVVEWADTTGNPLTVLTARTELYGQYEEWCIERGLDHLKLPAFQRECETMGEDNPIERRINEVYESGISGAEIHENSQRYFGQKLPCQLDGGCQYMEKREFDPDDQDVLIGHYLQAHNREHLEDRYVAIDEFPGDAFFFEPTHNEATRAISNYLKKENDLPFESWKDLRNNWHKHEEAVEEWREDLGLYSHRDTRVSLQRNPGFHAHAPLLTHAGLEFERLENEWECAKLGSGRIAVRSPEDEWTVLIPPPFYVAESLIALDGTPTISKWRLALGDEWIHREEVLDSNEEKRDYLRDVLGLEIKQTNAGAKPYQSGTHVNTNSDGALLESIYEQEGDRPSVITSKQAREKYEQDGINEYIDSAEHYGNLKGSNEFAENRLGVISGSPHPPEGRAVKRWGALDGKAISRKTDEDGRETKGTNLDFGAYGNALFSDVVDKEVLQAVMRFGRTGEHEATVYVHTSRLPRWIDAGPRLKVTTWSNGMQEVITALRESDEWPDGELTNKEIAKETSVGDRQVAELMKELEEEGYVTHRRGGRGNPYHWSDVCLDQVTAYGRVDQG